MANSLKAVRAHAIARGMTFIERVSRNAAGFAQYGTGLLYCCSFMADTARDRELARCARSLAIRGFEHWRSYNGELAPDAEPEIVVDAINCYAAAERIGFRDPSRKAKLRRAARKYTVEDFLQFDPREEDSPANVPETCRCLLENLRGRRVCANPECREKLAMQSRHRVWCIALTSVFCADRYGAPIGIRYAEIMQALPRMRRYAGPREGNGRPFYDALYAITHIVYTMNDYGRYLLSPSWLPHEFDFLMRHLYAGIETDDPDMVGEFLDSLRAFGLSDEHPYINAGFDYLLGCQNRDGSWGDRALDPYARFHATWAVIDGLREFRWNEERLSFPELLPDLKAWARQA